MRNEVISLTSVTKTFVTGFLKKKIGVKDLTFSVDQGEVVGLLGANGSGKSTTIKMILGFLKPTEGEILVCGKSAQEKSVRSLIGYLPENPRFQRFLTAREVMLYFGQLLGMSGMSLKNRSESLLELVGLRGAADERIQGFSKGMTQRLAMAQTLLNQPRLLILDEPMSGLDPLGRREIRAIIAHIHDEWPEVTIFFSTHILGDVEQVCSSVILLKQSILTRQCSLEELLSVDDQRFELVARNLSDSLQKKYLATPNARMGTGGLQFVIDGIEPLMTSLAEIRRTGGQIVALNSQRKNLEEALFGEQMLNSSPKLSPFVAETGT